MTDLEKHKHMEPLFSAAFEPIASHYQIDLTVKPLSDLNISVMRSTKMSNVRFLSGSIEERGM